MKSYIILALALLHAGPAAGHRIRLNDEDVLNVDEGSAFVELDASEELSSHGGCAHYVPQDFPQPSVATIRSLMALGLTPDQITAVQALGVLQDAPEDTSAPASAPSEDAAEEDEDGADEPIDPAEFALAEQSLQQCARSNVRRMIRIATSVPVFIMASEVVLTFGLEAEIYHSFLEGVYRATAQPIENILIRPFINSIPTVARGIVALPLVFSSTALTLAWLTTAYVFTYGLVVISIAPVAAAVVVPFVQAMVGAVQITNAGVDMASNALIGHGNEYPRCCCPSELLGSGESACALISMNGGQCLEGWVHQPSLCAVPEAVMFNDEQTVHGCACKNYTACATNALYKGHAWCEVSGPSGCGVRYSASSSRLDHCRIDGRPLDYATGRSTSTEDALATFIPNTFSGDLAGRVGSAFGLGTWVDGNRGLCTAKNSAFGTRYCFAGLPMETLGGCAKACLEDGAPNAQFTMDNLGNSSDNLAVRGCVAFAYHRQMHTCVRLPAMARHAEFTPHLNAEGGDGWQNFVSKYVGGDRSRSCSSDVLDEIVQAGYSRVRDLNDGHIEVRCSNVDRVQKVSCLASECDGRSSWCFVRNGCRSRLIGGCSRLSDLEHLRCSGVRGAIVPSSDPEGGSEYWNAINTLSRCDMASSIRRTNIMVGAPLLFLIGDAAFFIHLNGGGIVGAAVGHVLEGFTAPFAEGVVTVGAAIFEPAFNLRTVSYLLNAAWYTIMAAFSAIFYVSGFTIAIAPAAATFLVPVVSSILGVQAIVSVTADTVANFMGYGANYPKCCCAPGQDDAQEPACALVTSTTDSICPTHWAHDPSQCNVPEAIRFSTEQTPMGCQCSNYTACTSNAPYRGHAWCDVEGDECGMHHTFRRSNRWDYCAVGGEPLTFATGSSTSSNDALSTFIPNEYETWPAFLGPENAFRVGTWTNAERGLATAGGGSSRQCFAGIPAETSAACAHMCLSEGAPSARAMSGFDTSLTHTCVAFAFNRAQGICVRLPAFGADAKFTPALSTWDGPGWQNFVSMYHGADACSVTDLLAIERTGFSVSTSSNDGHLQLYCTNGSPQTQKASCRRSECPRGVNWCFVENDCGGFGNACTGMRNPDPLGCLAAATE